MRSEILKSFGSGGYLELESASFNQRPRGFTLIEFAIVMLISGLLIVPLLQLYTQYTMQKVWNDTKAHVDLARTVVIDYQLNNNRYPCPADRTLPRTDPNYGREDRDPVSGKCNVALAVGAGACDGQKACRAG